MGTAISVDVRDAGLADGALDAVFAWFRHVDETFSTYKEHSQISRLGRGDVSLADCDAEVAWVLERCADISRATNGAFDARAAGRLDPSGFVKGWSVDVASAILTGRGGPNHCVNAGGDIRVRGAPEPGRPWRTGIVHPFVRDALTVVVEGSDIAVATSGTAERGLHVVDPRSGMPAGALASVTLVGPELSLTDAYATAALAMGLAAPSWLETLVDHEAYVIDSGGHCWWTPG
ncbi:MAG: putative thiamine biosynthesis lipoprotein, partial [Acidimicrobiales bacterium]|nr:putative thiamine biosynthesis lipoprotein [Acidimicrobiales bacterium]